MPPRKKTNKISKREQRALERGWPVRPADTREADYVNSMTPAQREKYLAYRTIQREKAKAKAIERMKERTLFDPEGYAYDDLEDISPEEFENYNSQYYKTFDIDDNDYRSNNWYKAVSNRDLNFNPQLLIKGNAQKLAKKHKGRAFFGDVDGDYIDDVSVFDRYGKLIAFNGYQPRPSKHPKYIQYLKDYPDVDKIRAKDFNEYNYGKAGEMNSSDLRTLNRYYKSHGFEGYKLKKVRETINEMLNESIKKMYDLKFNNPVYKGLVPFTQYKSVIIRAYLNMLFKLDYSTLSTDDYGKIITKVINKKGEQYDKLRAKMVEVFKALIDKQDAAEINSMIGKNFARYRYGEEETKRSTMEMIGNKLRDNFVNYVGKPGQDLSNYCRYLLKEAISKDDTQSFRWHGSSIYDEDYSDPYLMINNPNGNGGVNNVTPDQPVVVDDGVPERPSQSSYSVSVSEEIPHVERGSYALLKKFLFATQKNNPELMAEMERKNDMIALAAQTLSKSTIERLIEEGGGRNKPGKPTAMMTFLKKLSPKK